MVCYKHTIFSFCIMRIKKILSSIFLGVISLVVLFILGCYLLRHKMIRDSILEQYSWVSHDSVMCVTGALDSINLNVLSINVPDIDYSEKMFKRLDDVFDTLFVVPLQTNDESVIGYINQVNIIDDIIYVLDIWQTKSIKAFSMDGKFIKRYGKEGNGPFEYVEPSDIHICDGYINVFDQWQQKVIEYDMNGDNHREHFLPFMCQQIMKLDSLNWLFRGINADNFHLPEILDCQFWQCDTSLRIIKKGVYRKANEYPSYWNIDALVRTLNDAYYHDEISDTLYTINLNGSLTPQFRFLVPNKAMESMKEKKLGNLPHINCIYFNNDLLMYHVSSNKKPVCYMFHDMLTGEDVYFNNTNFKESQLSRLLFMTSVECTYGEYVIFTIGADRLAQVKEHALQDEYWWD